MVKYKPKILIVDNYDSFTYNLVQILKEHHGCIYDILKNDTIDPEEAGEYDGFLFSPGPGIPSQVPCMAELLMRYQERKSFLGVCLGHQAIAEFYGMKLRSLGNVRHGLAAQINIIDTVDYLFKGLPVPFTAGLYHSWIVSSEECITPESLPIKVTALSIDGIIMAISHLKYDIKGIQFHPESYLSPGCPGIIHNWIENIAFKKSLSE